MEIEEIKQIEISDVVVMKKPHPCGCNEFTIFRTGIEFRLKCNGCDHLIMLNRTAFTKSVKKIIKK